METIGTTNLSHELFLLDKAIIEEIIRNRFLKLKLRLLLQEAGEHSSP